MIKGSLILFIFFILSGSLFAQKAKIDSLERLLPNTTDTLRANVLTELCWAYRNSKPEKALEYALEAQKILESKKGDIKKKLAKVYNFIGVIYRNMAEYPTALEYYFRGLKLAEQIGDKDQVGYAYQTIGNIYNRKGDYNEAIINVDKGMKAFTESKNENGLAYCYYTYGQIYNNLRDFDKSLFFHFKALKIREKGKDQGSYASSLMQIGITYQSKNEIDNALKYLTQALEIDQKIEDTKNIILILNKLAHIYIEQNELDIAKTLSIRSLSLSKETGLKEFSKESTHNLAIVFSRLNDYKKAFEYQNLFIAYNDSLSNIEVTSQFSHMKTNFEKDKIHLEFQLLKTKSARDSIIVYALIIAFILIAITAVIFLKNINDRKKANELLTLQKKEIEVKNSELHRKNDDITASITYAKRIQTAILPFEERISTAFADYFILFKPRDIVSGDFYWFHTKNNKVIIAVADCTGHGVPGAFMSMIGNELLNSIVTEKGILTPNQILFELNKGIRYALKQDQNDSRDGMDIAICVIDHDQKMMLYSGAMNGIFIIQNEQLKVLSGDKRSIGGKFSDTNFEYSCQTIDISIPTCFNPDYANKF